MENKAKDENKSNHHRLFKNIPKDTLAESQATMRTVLLGQEKNNIKNRP